MNNETKIKARLVRLSDVLVMTGIKAASTLNDMIRRGDFPKPVKIGRMSYWPTEEVEAWLDALIAGGKTNNVKA